MPSAIEGGMKIFSLEDLEQLTASARDAARQRRNLNLHDSYDDPCQRLFNAIEPGTYIRPHRHATPPKSETFVVVRGELALVTFDDAGGIQHYAELCAGGCNLAADLRPGVWHMVVSLMPGTIFFETKPGPYVPLSDKDFAPWAPPEGSVEAHRFLQKLLAAYTNRGAGGDDARA